MLKIVFLENKKAGQMAKYKLFNFSFIIFGDRFDSEGLKISNIQKRALTDFTLINKKVWLLTNEIYKLDHPAALWHKTQIILKIVLSSANMI